MTTGVRGWVWGATAGSFVVLWALFFVVLSRRPHEPSLRENASWLAFVVGLTASFVSALWAVEGGRATADFASEYLQQYVLSVDAVFLTAATMARFATPRSFQQKAIVVATSIALVIRTIMVLAGWVLTNVWVWLAFVTAVL